MKYGHKYTWQHGLKVKLNAQKIGKYLDELKEKHGGRITKQQIVDAARPSSSPIHSWFEWDDSIAAEKYRLEQASKLIQSIVIIETDNGDRVSGSVPSHVSVVIGKRHTYVSTTSAMKNDELREQVLEQAKKELKAWRNRYSNLREFAELMTQIDQLV